MIYDNSSSAKAGRLWLAALGMSLALAGMLFTWVLWTAWQRAEETRRWTPTPCLIVSSRLEKERPTPHSNHAFKAQVKYSYTFDGKAKTGTRIKRVDIASQHEDVARKKIEPYPVGTETTCFVNPAQPDFAVLKHDTRAALYSMWFPLLFVFGGLRMTWGAAVNKG
jgi:hypothetical protein